MLAKHHWNCEDGWQHERTQNKEGRGTWRKTVEEAEENTNKLLLTYLIKRRQCRHETIIGYISKRKRKHGKALKI